MCLAYVSEMCLCKQLLTSGVEAAVVETTRAVEKTVEVDPLLATIDVASEVPAAPLDSTGELRKHEDIYFK